MTTPRTNWVILDSLTELLWPWGLCGLCSALILPALPRLDPDEWLKLARLTIGLVSLAYCGPGLLYCVIPRLRTHGGLPARARKARLGLQLSARIALFLLPLLASLWLLYSRLEIVPVSSWSEVEEMLRGRVAEIQYLVRFIVWFPLGGVVLALVA